MPVYQHAVGKKLYVWSTGSQGQGSQAAVISAHGEQTLINQKIKLGKLQLQYFAPHGHILDTYSVTDFLKSNVKSDYIVENESPEYVLTKFQTHEAKTGVNGKIFSDTYDDLRQLQDRELWLDVVTIRNRGPFGSSIKLSEVIQTLAAHNFHYDVIACNFCRGPQVSFGKLPHTRMTG